MVGRKPKTDTAIVSIIEKTEKTEKPKKTRKPRSKKNNDNNDNNECGDNDGSIQNVIIEKSDNIEKNNVEPEIKIPKKRGRKPKGGKIIPNPKENIKSLELSSNVVLHLRVSKNDITEIIQNELLNKNNKYSPIKAYNPEGESNYYELDKTNNSNHELNNDVKNIDLNNHEINNNEVIDKLNNEEYHTNTHSTINEANNIKCKLKELEQKLRKNQVNDKKSNCFWCTYDFVNLPVYIPKFVLNDEYNVYGCFCSPECAAAYLFKENLDSTTKYERYHLLNHLYSPIFKYEKSIKPAPNPYYTLHKYLGTFTIEEYRKHLCGNDNYFIIVEKPLTKIVPELYEETNINFTNINSNGNLKFKRKNKIL
jgi:hypothetical protein